jgi:hypothetical protein
MVSQGLINVCQSAAVEVYQSPHRYGRAISAAFSGSVVFTLATTES